MAFDYQKANITLNNATGNTDGNVGTPASVGVAATRSLDQTTGTVQFQANDTTYDGRYKNLANLDLSSGVFIGHVGHNSPYRTFADGFARWRFFSGGSATTDYVEFDTFSIATVGDDPRTIAHVMDLNATPSRSSGTFDPTDVTRVQYSESRNAASPSTVLIYISFWTHASSNNSANTPVIHGTTSIENFVRELRNDNFGSGLGGPTGNGTLTDAVRNTSALLSFNMPVAFGKTGVATVIDGTGFDYQIGVNSTLYHLTGQGILWTNNWDTSVAGQSLDLTDTSINMLTPSDWTVFDIDSANVAITLTGTTITNAGDIRLGSSCTGTPSAITMGANKVLTVANSIDNYNVTGTLRYEGGAGVITGVSATRLILEQAGDYTFTDCTITEVENVSGGAVIITTNKSLVTIETNGTISVIDSLLSFSGVDSWIVYANEADRDANTNELGSGTGNFRFIFSAATSYYLRLVSGAETIFKTVTPTQIGETSVDLSTAGLLTLTNSGLALTNSGVASLVANLDTNILKYKEGFVYYSESRGVAGQVLGTHGTFDNPVNSVADAEALAESLTTKKIFIVDGNYSYISATNRLDNYHFRGADPQSVLIISGGSTAESSLFENLSYVINSGASISGSCKMRDCILTNIVHGDRICIGNFADVRDCIIEETDNLFQLGSADSSGNTAVFRETHFKNAIYNVSVADDVEIHNCTGVLQMSGANTCRVHNFQGEVAIDDGIDTSTRVWNDVEIFGGSGIVRVNTTNKTFNVVIYGRNRDCVDDQSDGNVTFIYEDERGSNDVPKFDKLCVDASMIADHTPGA